MQLIDLLEHPTLKEAAVAAFEVISIEFPQLHLPVIQHFFKQKLFQMVLKKLWEKFENYSEHHLGALIYVLKMAPHQVLKNNIEKVGPILLKCLGLKTNSSLLIALAICERFLQAQDEFFRDRLQIVVNHCLRLCILEGAMVRLLIIRLSPVLTKFSHFPPQKIRIAAIQCLQTISEFPAFIVLPLCQDVLLGLQTPLDDDKRLVRNAAVLARNQWFLIGAPTTSK